ncbi:MAG TPA: ATP-binding protein [Polyangiaceae bacterium]|nr:ATP-binding protein [Polyangiaceae bacterium]
MSDDEDGPADPEEERPRTWDEYADPKGEFSAEELIGDVRSTSVREAPLFLEWLGQRLGLEAATVARKLVAWHGHGNLRAVFAASWPITVDAPPREALGSVTVAAARDSPSMIRWIADTVGLQPQAIHDRVADAHGRSLLGTVVPEILGSHSSVTLSGEGAAVAQQSFALPAARKREALEVLKADRLRELVRAMDVGVENYKNRDALVSALADGRRVDFRAVLAELSRDELKAMCVARGLSPGGKEKGSLVDRLLNEAGATQPSPVPNGGASPLRAPSGPVNLPSTKKRIALDELKAERLRELVRELDVDATSYRDRDALIDALADGRRIDFSVILSRLSRDELRAMCEALGFDVQARDKSVLVDRILRGDGPDADDSDVDTEAEDETSARDESAAVTLARLASSVLKLDRVGSGWPSVGVVRLATEAVPITAYIRAIGRSGRSRPTERRFQNPANRDTRVIREPEKGYALLLGFWDEQGEGRAVVVAMDAYRRVNQNTRTSLFMPLALLEEAADTGHAEHRSHSGEVVYAFRPQNLPAYVERLMLEAGFRAGRKEAGTTATTAPMLPISIAARTLEEQVGPDGHVQIRPKVGMYAAFARLNYKAWFAIAEFVDNSIQSYLSSSLRGGGEPLLIDIRIDDDEIVITDRAAGIAEAAFPRAFSPSQPPPDASGLSEFGLGMKAAACWFARQWAVRTSALGEPVERTIEFDVPRITREGIESLPVTQRPVPKEDHHTVVTLSQLLQRPRGRTIAKIKDHLQSIYRVLIRKGIVRIRLSTGSATEELAYVEPPLLVAPHFREPEGVVREWRREFDFKLEQGQRVWGWAGLLETGNVSRAGFSVFRRDRLIQGSADETYRPAELCRTPNSYTYQRLVGEIFVEGFDVSHTKDGIQWAGLEELVISRLKMDLNRYDLPLLSQAEGHRARRKARDLEPGFGLSAVTSTGAALATDAVGEALAQQIQEISKVEEIEPGESPKAAPEKILTVRTFTVNVQQSHLPWSVTIELVSDAAADWFQRGSKTKVEERSIHVLLNLAHPFSEQFINDAEATLDPLLRVVCGLALAEETARESGVLNAGQIRIRLNKLLRGALGARARESEA